MLCLAVAAVSLSLAGCSGGPASILKQAAAKTSAAALQESLSTLEQADTRERIQKLMATPEMRQAIREAAEAAANEALVERIAALGTRSALHEAAHDWPATLGPAIEGTMTSTMDSVEFRRALDDTAGEVTESVLASSRSFLDDMAARSESVARSHLSRIVRAATIGALVFSAILLGLIVWGIRSQVVLTRLLRDREREHGPPAPPPLGTLQPAQAQR